MEAVIQALVRRFGTDMTLLRAGVSRSVRGFFQAVNAKSWQGMESQASLLGEITRGQYLFLGPADAAVAEGDVLEVGAKRYLFRRAEQYLFAGQVLYCWGLCVEKGVNDTWGSPS